VLELVKVSALAALVGLIASRWWDTLDSATAAVAVLYLLTVRISKPTRPTFPPTDRS
jgi:hypothetical protein